MKGDNMFRTLILSAALAVAVILPAAAQTQPRTSQQSVVSITRQTAVQAAQTINLPLNKSQVLRVSEPVKKVTVGNAEIVDAVPLTDRSFYVLGKAVGTTNVS